MIKADVRILAVTHQYLKDMSKDHSFVKIFTIV